MSLHFLQVFWITSKIKFTERTIWSLHPVYVFTDLDFNSIVLGFFHFQQASSQLSYVKSKL